MSLLVTREETVLTATVTPDLVQLEKADSPKPATTSNKKTHAQRMAVQMLGPGRSFLE
jgi:hypothetical protein